MTATTSKPTIPDELRKAATLLRCEHSFPCQPPHGSLANPGPCKHCGTTWNAWCAVSDVPQVLLEPLAEWLEMEAHMHDKRGNSAEGSTFHALKVAHALNRGA